MAIGCTAPQLNAYVGLSLALQPEQARIAERRRRALGKANMDEGALDERRTVDFADSDFARSRPPACC